MEQNLSAYIHKQLSTILTHVKAQPPRRTPSLSIIKKLVFDSPLDQHSKKKISKTIHKLETEIKQSHKAINPYKKQLFLENMLLTEKAINKQQQQRVLPIKLATSNEFNYYLQKIDQLKTMRLKKEHQISELIIQARRLQRLIQLKKQNKQIYLKSILSPKSTQTKSKNKNYTKRSNPKTNESKYSHYQNIH